MFTLLQGYIVRETEAAVAFVKASDAGKTDAPVLELPRKKTSSIVETDAKGATIETKKYGQRVGFPVEIEADSEFLARVRFQA